MEYLFLVYHDEKAWAERSDEDRQAVFREYDEVADEHRDHGSYIPNAPLLPTTVASTVRVRDAEQLVTDGPFRRGERAGRRLRPHPGRVGRGGSIAHRTR